MEKAYLGQIERQKILNEKELKNQEDEQHEKQVKFQMMKEKIYLSHHSQEELEQLFELVEKGVLSKDSVTQKLHLEDSQKQSLELRLQTLSASYESIEDKFKYLPEELIITRENMLAAIYDKTQRKYLCKTLRSGLSYMSKNISPLSIFSAFPFFSGSLYGTNKNIVFLQEFYIDTIGVLEELD
ncbi:hypothetical protein LAT59_01045 [Candidatus Gracilibacteria bacterium]|nr:hypothetical protein [Candidatus Gracilibacteria bacterium]